MPSTRRTLLAAGFCLCCAPVRAALRLREAAPGIHIRAGVDAEATAANHDAIANIGFVAGHTSVAVFDPGGSLEDGQRLRQALRQTTQLPVSHVILSHVHPDHIFGAAAFADENPVLIGHANLPALLATRGAFYRQNLARSLGANPGPVPAPTRLVHETATIDLGGRTLHLTAHPPAHTLGDLSAFDPATGTLLAGDLLFLRRVPALDGDLKGWLGVLAALKRAPATTLVPGHGPISAPWPAAAADLERYLTALLSQTRAAVAKAMPIDQAARTLMQAERSRWALFDAYNPRNVLEAYHQLEWE